MSSSSFRGFDSIQSSTDSVTSPRPPPCSSTLTLGASPPALDNRRGYTSGSLSMRTVVEPKAIACLALLPFPNLRLGAACRTCELGRAASEPGTQDRLRVITYVCVYVYRSAGGMGTSGADPHCVRRQPTVLPPVGPRQGRLLDTQESSAALSVTAERRAGHPTRHEIGRAHV